MGKKIMTAAVAIVAILFIGFFALTHLKSQNGILAPATSTQGAALANAPPEQNQSTINPGFEPYFSCPLETAMPIPIQIVNASGMSTYNVSGVSDYVLPAGSSGSISYGTAQSGTILAQGPVASTALQTGPQNTRQNKNTIDSVILYHQLTMRANYTITQINGTSNQTNSTNQTTYKVCYTIQGTGTLCNYGPSKPSSNYKMVSTVSLTHPGIATQANFSDKSPWPLSNYTVLNITSASNATEGTYWMSIAGGPCNGGQIALLTIGDSPFAPNSITSSHIYS